MPDILITEFMDERSVDWLAGQFDTEYAPDLADRQGEIPARLGGARALIVRNRTEVSAGLLDAAPSLSVVGRLGVGLDNIDQAAAATRKVEVIPATGANDAAVAEYVISAALILLRGAWHASAEVAGGSWPRQRLIGREIGSKTLGLLGFGGIARQTAARARSLGMSVLAHDPFASEADPAWTMAERVGRDALLARSDVLSLHVPLTAETRHSLSAPEFAALPAGAIVINAARGGVLDETALATALASGHLGGAALDVFEKEPLTAEAGAPFAGLNVLLTPHIAGVTEESNVRVSRMIAEAVAARLA
ncbi:MAG: hydroxyacid dehydrogenase [Pseudomonadota bacterium]